MTVLEELEKLKGVLETELETRPLKSRRDMTGSHDYAETRFVPGLVDPACRRGNRFQPPTRLLRTGHRGIGRCRVPMYVLTSVVCFKMLFICKLQRNPWLRRV